MTAVPLPDTSRFASYVGNGSIFDTIYSPVARQTVAFGAGDVLFDSYGLEYVFNNHEFC